MYIYNPQSKFKTPERLMIFQVGERKESEDSRNSASPWLSVEASAVSWSIEMPKGTQYASGPGLMRLVEVGEMTQKVSVSLRSVVIN